MQRIMIILCGFLVISILGCASAPPHTDVSAVLEAVEIGGMEQWIWIRGVDWSNPVLLWLHGGPGAAHMPVAHRWAAELEEHFVVVHWDQRGAGKSNPRDFDQSTMTIERFVEDLHEMTAYLQHRLHADRLYLVAHSWGTEMALHALHERPANYVAYIGVAQVVNRTLGAEIAYRRLLLEDTYAGPRWQRRKLCNVGAPPYVEHARYGKFMRVIDDHGGSFDVPMRALAVAALRSPAYGWNDLFAWLRGANRGSGPMWDQPEYRDFDARLHVPRLEVPAFFVMGARDLNTPLEAVRLYYQTLDAPMGKELIVFEDAAHTPFFQDERRFVEELVLIKERTWSPGTRTFPNQIDNQLFLRGGEAY